VKDAPRRSRSRVHTPRVSCSAPAASETSRDRIARRAASGQGHTPRVPLQMIGRPPAHENWLARNEGGSHFRSWSVPSLIFSARFAPVQIEIPTSLVTPAACSTPSPPRAAVADCEEPGDLDVDLVIRRGVSRMLRLARNSHPGFTRDPRIVAPSSECSSRRQTRIDNHCGVRGF
jgi:hypothetical protein